MIDLSRVLAGPFATMLLADLGADVVKVEPPSGDETRGVGTAVVGRPGRSAGAPTSHRSIGTSAASCSTCRPMTAAPRATGCWRRRDVLVHNYRPATAARLGLSTDALRQRHPRLVVSTVGGFAGAEADRPAYDLLAQAVSGLMSVTGEPDGPPMKVGVALLDLIAGLECAVGALAALVGRRGSSASVNLVEAGVTSLINVLGNHLATGAEPGRHGTAHPNIAPYQSFEARDGHLVVAVGNDAQFARLLGVLDLADADGRFATNARRVGARDGARGVARRRDRHVGSGSARGCAVRAPTCRPGRSTACRRRSSRWARNGSRSSTAFASRRARCASTGSSRPLRRPPPRLGEHTDRGARRARVKGVERETGIEPATCSLEGCRSAN